MKKIELDQQEVIEILGLLGKLPYENVAVLITFFNKKLAEAKDVLPLKKVESDKK